METVLSVSMRSWWPTGMIPEKLTCVQFPARISTVFSKLLPSNDLIFQFLIKHQTFAPIDFLAEYQNRQYDQLCSI